MVPIIVVAIVGVAAVIVASATPITAFGVTFATVQWKIIGIPLFDKLYHE